MGTLVFNWRGLFATILVGIPVFSALNWLENVRGWPVTSALAFTAVGMTLPLALLACVIDRCDRKGALRPYWENSLQFCFEMYGHDPPEWFSYHPGRRTAWCVWPLALGPYIILLTYLVVWVCAAVQGHPAWLLPQLLCVLAAAVGAIVFAKTTEWVRVLPEWLDESDLVEESSDVNSTIEVWPTP
jgi:hypothetical protein